MPMEKVLPTQVSRAKGTKYEDITEMEVEVGDYYKIFKLNMFISSVKEKNENSYKGLLCLNNNKSEMQIVLEISFTKNTLKM